MHEFQTRVYYEDTDSGGVVFYANYLKFIERARTELLREQNFENKSLAENEGILFVVRKVNADYLKPAKLDDLLTIHTEILSVKNASVLMKQAVFRPSNDAKTEEIFSAEVTLACIDAKSSKPIKMPEALKECFEHYMRDKNG